MFEHLTDERAEVRDILTAIRSRLTLIAHDLEIIGWNFQPSSVELSYRFASRRGKVRLARPTTSRKAAEAVLHHAQHFSGIQISAVQDASSVGSARATAPEEAQADHADKALPRPIGSLKLGETGR